MFTPGQLIHKHNLISLYFNAYIHVHIDACDIQEVIKKYVSITLAFTITLALHNILFFYLPIICAKCTGAFNRMH